MKRALEPLRSPVAMPMATGPQALPGRLSLARDLQQIEQEYRAFEQRADCTPFQTFDWLSTWHHHIGKPAGVEIVVICGYHSSGDLLFILPLAIEQFEFSRRLAFLGHRLCDYNAPLLAPEFSSWPGSTQFISCWRAIENMLQRTPGCNYDFVYFDKMPERVGGQENPLLELGTSLNPSSAYRANFDSDWDAFYARRQSSERRRRDRVRRKKLSEEGPIGFVLPTATRDVQDTLTVLFEQKSRAFERMGVGDLFAQTGHQDFYRKVVNNARDKVFLSRLNVGTKCVAVTFGLLFRGCFYQLLISYEHQLARFAPGTAQLHEVMQHLISRGHRQFDFTIGDEPFKLEWCDEQLKLHDYIAGITSVGRLQAAMLALQARAKRSIKRSDRLSRFARRVRSVRHKLASVIPGKRLSGS